MRGGPHSHRAQTNDVSIVNTGVVAPVRGLSGHLAGRRSSRQAGLQGLVSRGHRASLTWDQAGRASLTCWRAVEGACIPSASVRATRVSDTALNLHWPGMDSRPLGLIHTVKS